MKRLTFFMLSINLVLMFSPGWLFAQKLYIWCPQEQSVKSRGGFLKNEIINVIIKDSRNIPLNSKNECSEDALTSAIFNFLKKSYPSAVFNKLSNEAYYQKADSEKITLKIGIEAYQAGFGNDVTTGIGNLSGNLSSFFFTKGVWNSLTALNVQIFDNRNNSKKRFQKDINAQTAKSNLLGYRSARAGLDQTYSNVINHLAGFIDDSLIQE